MTNSHFYRGVVSVFNLSGDSFDFKRRQTQAKVSDTEKLKSDMIKIGKDLNEAYQKQTKNLTPSK